MPVIFFLVLLVIGASGLIAQVVLMRELLVSFYGNELTLGIIIANWLAAEALGVYLAGRVIDRLRNTAAALRVMIGLFCCTLIPGIYLSRAYKALLGISPGEGAGLPLIFLASLVVVFPAAFIHGGLFGACCSFYSKTKTGQARGTASALGIVYAGEIIGTIAGGFLVTYAFIPHLSSFRIAFIVTGLNLLLIPTISPRRRGSIAAALVIAVVCIAAFPLAQRLELSSSRLQIRSGSLLAYRNSVYGNIAVSRAGEQYTFFSNGIPVITTPYPDTAFVEDFAHIPLLMHQHPGSVLVIGAGAGGLIREILKHPVRELDYVELDPLMIAMLKAFPTPLTAGELNDPRVRVINTDARFRLHNSPKRYDAVLIGFSRPGDLTVNRFFTVEFFRLVKDRLNPGGIAALWLPGSLTYISPELGGINRVILDSLDGAFERRRVVPGDYNIVVASDDRAAIDTPASLMAQRLDERAVKTQLVSAPYLEYRMQKHFADWFEKQLSTAAGGLNQDYTPRAVYKTLVLWNKEFSRHFFNLLKKAESLNIRHIALLAVIWTLLVIGFARAARSRRVIIGWVIAASGFFGMMSTLILVFSFQVVYGYLYQYIGILIGIFMAGLAAGSFLITRVLGKLRAPLNVLLAFETAILVFSLLLAVILPGIGAPGLRTAGVFCVLFLTAGFLIGAEFPLCAKLLRSNDSAAGETAGFLYFADLAGGWVAGMLGGVILVPVLGAAGACLTMALLKAGSLIAVAAKRTLT